LINSERLVNTFLELVDIDNPSGHEEAIQRIWRNSWPVLEEVAR
jgi:di/tripeptidase